MQTWHLRLTADGRRPLFPDEAAIRRAVQTLARVAGPDLLLFSIVDDRVDIGLCCVADRTPVLARSLLLALRPLADATPSPTRPQRIEGRSHLLWLLRHCIQQAPRSSTGHPALWSGSCFLDLVGARVIEGYAPPLPQLLPRLRQRSIFEHAGLPALPLTPLSDDALRRVGHGALVDAATAALAAPPALQGRTPLVVTCRRAIAQLGTRAGLRTGQIADLLGVVPRAAHRLSRAPQARHIRDAILRRLALEERVRQLALGATGAG